VGGNICYDANVKGGTHRKSDAVGNFEERRNNL